MPSLWFWIVLWLCILAIVIIAIWFGKHVSVPTITVNTNKDSYARNEVVQITGTVKQGATPLPGKTVKLAIQGPGPDAWSLPDATTDSNGLFSTSWTVPADAANGDYTLNVSCLGSSASKTFRPDQMAIN
jgi:uncharacterized protein YfaS (alpha-2-macroglobulin family)